MQISLLYSNIYRKTL